MSRSHELRFAATELLFRQVAHYQLRGNYIKPQALRLQISVARSQYESAEQLQQRAKRASSLHDGVLQIDAQRTRQCAHGLIHVTCIDDPHDQNPSHALIAMWTEATPEHQIDEDVERVRALLSREMKLVLPPTVRSK